MTEPAGESLPPLSLARRVDSICDTLESAWLRGERLTLESLLTSVPAAEQAVVLRELVQIEIFHRVKSGELPQLEDYQRRFASLDPAWLAVVIERSSPAGDPSETARLGIHTPFSATRSLTGHSNAAADESPLAPNSVSGFEILGELGRGGMGVVYKARQHGVDRVVAIKMILAGGRANTEALARFQTEAAAIARVQHANIVQVHDFGQHAGQPYFSLEYIDGGTLAQRIAGVPQPPRDSARLIETLARAIQQAHQAGVIHRDLKPANILLTKDGVPKITDFGLAKLAQTDHAATASGMLLGTPLYMAPEQAAGHNRDTGPAADIYSLGAILYELLTGRPPFQAPSLSELLRMIGEREPVSPRLLKQSTPRDLETICLKCLQKSPGARYASAGELADDLQRFLAGEPIQARPVGVVERTWRWSLRNPLVAGLMASVVVSLALGTTISTILAFQANRSAKVADAKTEEANKQKKAADANAKLFEESDRKNAQLAIDEGRARDRAEGRLMLADLRSVNDLLQRGEYGRAEQLLLAGIPEDDRPDLRNWEWHYLLGECRRNFQRLLGHQQDCVELGISPDGQTLISLGGSGEVFQWDLRRLTTVQRQGINAGISSFAWRGQQPQFAIGQIDGKVRVQNVGETNAAHEWQVAQSMITALAWNPDGDRLACGTMDGWVLVWDANAEKVVQKREFRQIVKGLAWSLNGECLALAAGREFEIWNPTTDRFEYGEKHIGNGANCVAISPDGTLVAWGCDWPTFELRVLDRTTLVKRELWGHTEPIKALAWHPTKRWLATAGLDHSIRLWDLEASDRPALILDAHTRELQALAWSKTGSTLVATGNDRSISVWDLGANLATNRALLKFPVSLSTAAWSPNGEYFATVDHRRIQIWEAGGRLLPFQSRNLDYHPAIAWSPDGSRLAITNAGEADGSGRLIIWDVASGEDVSEVRDTHPSSDSVAWSPNGKRLVTGGGGGQIVVRETGKFSVLHRLQSSEKVRIFSISWSPDSRRFALAIQGGTMQIWDAEKGECLASAHDASDASAVAWSPTGKFIALAGDDGLIYDARTGKLLQNLSGHHGRVKAIAWSHDETRIATGGWDTTIRLWDPQEGNELLNLRQHTSWINALQFNRNGSRLLSASNDKTVHIWDATPGYNIARELATPWWIAGTFPKEFGAHFSPEFVATTRSPIESATGKPLTWRKVFMRGDYRLDLKTLIPQSEESSVYALTFVYSPVDQPAVVRFGVDDAAVIWVNGAQVYGVDTVQAAVFDSQEAPVKLRAGWNRILVRAINQLGDFELFFRLTAADPNTELKGLRWSHDPDKENLTPGNDPQALADRANFVRLEPTTDLEELADRYAKFLQQVPDDAGFRQEHALVLVRLSRLDEAVAEYARYAEQKPQDEVVMLQYAMLLAYQKRTEEYREYCLRLIKRRQRTSNVYTLERRAKACLLLPDALTDYTAVTADAEQSLALDPNETWSQMVVALAAYRCRDYARCQEVAAQALKGNRNFDCRVHLEFLQAMCLHRLNRPAEAQRLWKKAAAKPAPNWTAEDFRQAAGNWHDELYLELLKREAEETLKSPADAADR